MATRKSTFKCIRMMPPTGAPDPARLVPSVVEHVKKSSAVSEVEQKPAGSEPEHAAQAVGALSLISGEWQKNERDLDQAYTKSAYTVREVARA